MKNKKYFKIIFISAFILLFARHSYSDQTNDSRDASNDAGPKNERVEKIQPQSEPLKNDLDASNDANSKNEREEEIQRQNELVKQTFEELEKLKAKVAEMERRLLETERVSADTHKKLNKKEFVKFGGSLRSNSRVRDWDAPLKKRTGDTTLTFFNITATVQHEEFSGYIDYRFYYGTGEAIRLAYADYKFTDQLKLRFGIPRVPFGILPYDSNSWWFGMTYYLGFCDDVDFGGNLIYEGDVWDIRFGFFKNEEWGDASRNGKYSFDVVTDDNLKQYNQETNQFNFRAAYKLNFSQTHKAELGFSAEWGQLHNTNTNELGDHWAGAAHFVDNYGPFNFQLEVVKYRYNPKNPDDVSSDTIMIGGFFDSYMVASEADIYVANVNYKLPVGWGIIKNLSFYNDYSMIAKKGSDFHDTKINTAGLLLDMNPLYINFDFIFSKNAIWLNGKNNPMAQGIGNPDWTTMLNIHAAYYY